MDASQNGNIVRISDFCQRGAIGRRRRQRRQKHHGSSISHPENCDDSWMSNVPLDESHCSPFDISKEELSSSSSWDSDRDLLAESTVVNVTILKSLPSSNVPVLSGDDDEYATIYTDTAQLLLEIGVFNGQLCMISRDESDPLVRPAASQRNNCYWAPVIIKVCSNCEYTTHSSRFNISIPPNIAATIGLCDFGCLELPLKARICSLSRDTTSVLPFMKSIAPTCSKVTDVLPLAKKAYIVECFYPPDDYLPSLPMLFAAKEENNTVDIYRENEKSKQMNRLRNYFYRQHDCGRREAVSRLATIGSIFAVVDDSECNNNTLQYIVGSHVRSMIRFYQVQKMETDEYTISMDDPGRTRLFCRISPLTEVVLTAEKATKCCDIGAKMPQLSSTWFFHQSVRDGKQKVTYPSVMKEAWAHPNLRNIVETLVAINDMLFKPSLGASKLEINVSLSRHMLHIVGHEDNHIKHCLDVAADCVGMNIFHVSGLASFGFHWKAMEREDAGRNTVGTITDKIAGLKAAFRVAMNSLPCIIHVAYDGEIEADDVSIKYDEEQRLFSCLQQELRSAFDQGENVPPVIVVISTEQNLQHGPLSSLIIHDSVKIDHPDERYAMELWNDNDTFNHIKDTLSGRSAKEIKYMACQIRKMEQKTSDCYIPKAIWVQNVLKCTLTQKAHLNVFDTSSNKYSSHLIPTVRWDDVGGLSHVRDEIIDAIELPLKYPKLFSKSRRSGILFFGPPGSGKTLVAKAVASECGLPFLSVKGPELLGSYVGESESNIRSVFENAREAAKNASRNEFSGAAILFFDEIDSLAPRRGGFGDGGGVMDRVVSTLLGEMDKAIPLDSHGNLQGHVFVIGATNRPDLLDASLLRPGRFDKVVYLGLAKERNDKIQILAAQIRKFQFQEGEDPVSIAGQVIDSIPNVLSGADFSGIASGALMLALQRTCDEAEKEATTLGSSLEEVLSRWPKEKLIPRVKKEDFLAVAKTTYPSVTSSDLLKYDSLRTQFCPNDLIDS